MEGFAHKKKKDIVSHQGWEEHTHCSERSAIPVFLNDAIDNSHMETVDIPDALMQTDMEGEMVYMKMLGRMVEILTKLDPKMYWKHIQKLR